VSVPKIGIILLLSLIGIFFVTDTITNCQTAANCLATNIPNTNSVILTTVWFILVVITVVVIISVWRSKRI
jgi:hypothetical protein